MYRIREVAKILGFTERAVRQWVIDGKIKAVKIMFPQRRMLDAQQHRKPFFSVPILEPSASRKNNQQPFASKSYCRR